jgi:hypothetical protein
MNITLTLVVLAAALALAIGAAFVPMRLLLTHLGAHIHQFIIRQRERRAAVRETPQRRKESENPGPA